MVDAIGRLERSLIVDDPQPFGEGHDTTAAIAAHARLTAISVEIPHHKVVMQGIVKQDEAIGTDPEMPVAQLCNDVMLFGDGMISDIDDNEIIARTLVFFEGDLHHDLFLKSYQTNI
jgi:hypothetical protein